MHNNYHFLRALSRELAPLLKGKRIFSCYSQEKDELIIEIGEASLYIRAHFTPSFSCLTLTDQHKRARKNSVDLFRSVIGKTIHSVYQHHFERTISLMLSDESILTFKLFGNRSNVVYFTDGKVSEIFRSSLKQDYQIAWVNLDRSIDLGYEAFLAADGDPVKFCPTLGKPLREYLWSKGFAELAREKQYSYLMEFLEELSEPPYYVTEWDDRIRLSLVEEGTILSEHQSAIAALSDFFLTHQREGQLRIEKRKAIDQVGRELERALRYVDKNNIKLHALRHEEKYQQRADLIMANLHRFRDGKDSAVVANFYDNNDPIEIRIKPSVSPQKYAEKLYLKSKNQHIQVAQLEANIASRKKDIQHLQDLLNKVKETTDIRELRSLTGKPGQQVQASESLPYRSVEVDGYQVWIGKSARGNDELLKKCHKDDLWLHAKDSAGSHVIIKQRPGSGIPLHVKERAAELAAYYSKRKNDTLCPVILTHRKYVRKRKGDPAGMVRVDREEEILLVPPKG